MARIVCDVCGGDLLKDGEFFVCQTCGCKYTLEEVRKKLTGGNLPVSASAAVPAVPAAADGGAAAVHVSNAAQIENLMKMAQSAYDSKNYAKAENFCDQIIAMDSGIYEAWKLKGEAINFQITANNPRILEVFNCIMTAYKTLGPLEGEEKIRKIAEVLQSLKICMEGEVRFWVKQFENGRPTEASLAKAKGSFTECYSMMQKAFAEFGIDSTTYLKNFDNYFCEQANLTCVSAWKTTVAYNYFRDSLSNLGSGWNRNPSVKEYISSSVYRPDENIRSTFVSETDRLVNLLEFCVTRFNDLTLPELKKNIYSNISYFINVTIKQVSYKAMVSTTTNGFGAVISRREYYDVDRFLTDNAKRIRQKQAGDYSIKKAKLEAEEKQKKKDEYWEAHAEEKKQLLSEKETLNQQKGSLEKEIAEISDDKSIPQINEQISTLENQKKNLGRFAGKEKRSLQDQIDKLMETKLLLQTEHSRRQRELRSKIDPLEKRIREINLELLKDR